MKASTLSILAFVAASSLTFISPASALTQKECSAKYQAAQAANSLNGMKWNDFRKTQCADTAAAPAPAAAQAAPAAVPAPAPVPPKAKQAVAPVAPAAAAPAGATQAVFPTAVSTKYASESAGKARMHTCLDQYNANKPSGATGGLNWIEKGGGYYSQCNRRLKGA